MTRVTFLPSQTVVQAQPGDCLLDVARQAEIWISSSCGGQGLCTSCRVVISEPGEAISPAGRGELKQLGDSQLAQGMRLACQVRLNNDDVTVTVRG